MKTVRNERSTGKKEIDANRACTEILDRSWNVCRRRFGGYGRQKALTIIGVINVNRLIDVTRNVSFRARQQMTVTSAVVFAIDSYELWHDQTSRIGSHDWSGSVFRDQIRFTPSGRPTLKNAKKTRRFPSPVA